MQPASKASTTRGRRACPQRARRTGAAATDSRAREDAQLDDMAENDPDAYKKFMEEQMKAGKEMFGDKLPTAPGAAAAMGGAQGEAAARPRGPAASAPGKSGGGGGSGGGGKPDVVLPERCAGSAAAGAGGAVGEREPEREIVLPGAGAGAGKPLITELASASAPTGAQGAVPHHTLVRGGAGADAHYTLSVVFPPAVESAAAIDLQARAPSPHSARHEIVQYRGRWGEIGKERQRVGPA
jgi:hypothetical protein